MRFNRTLFAVLIFIFLSSISFAVETRGLQIVAKDPVSGKQGIIKLYDKSYAVIIGIDLYKNLPADRQLQNAVKDAKGVEEVLKKNYRFDRIVTLFNEQATKDRIMEVLTEELPAQMGNNDSLFIFWAGHGNQEKSDFGKIGYLIPYDGDAGKIRKNVTMAEIRDTISKKIPAKHVFYVMDACYSGLLTTRSIDKKTSRDLSYLKEITKESARQVLTAGGEGEEALDGGPKGHSVFTGRLIEILETSSDFITANELQASIKEKVYSDASARNHTQTPGFGALYGLGDFVFIPREKDVLGDLTGTSAARQKELEKLQIAEKEAAAAKKREQAEIAKKERELAVLDHQIAEMKGRLGTTAARSGDSLDQVIALAEQKEEQGKHLETLRQQREAEEEKRRQDIERLRMEAKRKQARQLETDLAKYQKVASSRYAQDMKGTAWAAMTAYYPAAKNVEVGNVDGFLAALGLANDGGEIVASEEKMVRENLRKEERRRAAEELAKITYTDSKTGLMWAKKDNGKSINWKDAKSYCENYRLGGFTDWRMPTQDELASLYNESLSGYSVPCCDSCSSFTAKVPDQIRLSCVWVWASETRGTEAFDFEFVSGGRDRVSCSSYYYRALPVRSGK